MDVALLACFFFVYMMWAVTLQIFSGQWVLSFNQCSKLRDFDKIYIFIKSWQWIIRRKNSSYEFSRKSIFLIHNTNEHEIKISTPMIKYQKFNTADTAFVQPRVKGKCDRIGTSLIQTNSNWKRIKSVIVIASIPRLPFHN